MKPSHFPTILLAAALAGCAAAHGLTFANVVKENVYTTDLDAFKKSGDVRGGYYGPNLPRRRGWR